MCIRDRFLICTVAAAYARGVYAVVVLLTGIFVYYIWVTVYTRVAYNRYVAERQAEIAVMLAAEENKD